ncbi:MAG TPA: DUF983 domain-containing protein [Rhizobiaceae bacterium]|nr:DUF983 domain-containing protein [Rhizobiaceae bacterium]
MTIDHFGGENHTGRPNRALREAMWRGFTGRCPHCGEGRLFRAYVKTVDECATCGEVISHHRADDLPAYLVIVIVGHIVVGTFMGMEMMFNLSTWQHLAIWVPITIAASLALLQPVKGAMVGLQWALYMHGFGGEADMLEAHPEQQDA